jgi:hypothetical protein
LALYIVIYPLHLRIADIVDEYIMATKKVIFMFGYFFLTNS